MARKRMRSGHRGRRRVHERAPRFDHRIAESCLFGLPDGDGRSIAVMVANIAQERVERVVNFGVAVNQGEDKSGLKSEIPQKRGAGSKQDCAA
jgi:hypothetical protein